MDEKQKKLLIVSVVLLVLAGAVVAFTMRGGGPNNTGEGMVNYGKQPPPDSAPLPADQGGGQAPVNQGSGESGRGM